MYNYKEREVYLIMKNNGFKFHHKTGSHAIFKNDKGEHISIGMNNCNGAVMHMMSKKYNLDLSLRK